MIYKLEAKDKNLQGTKIYSSNVFFLFKNLKAFYFVLFEQQYSM